MATRKRSPTKNMVGDATLDPTMIRDPGEQPLDEDGRALVKRAYELFDHFYQNTRAEHEAMKQDRLMRQKRQSERSPTAPSNNTLNSCADNVIADQIDNLPTALLMPEREEVANTAEEMTDMVQYVLYHAGWPGKYQELMEDSVVTGTGIAEVKWDDDLEDGEGMVNVIAWHPEDFYPDPAVENLQDGRACFKATRTTVAWVEEHYPHAKGYVQGEQADPDRPELYSLIPDGDEGVLLLEYWYRRYDAEKRKYRVHMALVAGHALLYSTELSFGGPKKGEYASGVYAHGMYPFTMFKYRNVWRQPFGTGLIREYADDQNAIDRYAKYIDDNARQSSLQKTYVRRGTVAAEDVANCAKEIVEYDGANINEDIQTKQAKPLNTQVFQMMQYTSDVMKQDCGQNQFSRGEGGLGVTAAAAIQALQEAGGKITRWHTEQYKDAFREMVEQILWVMSEYISPNRKFRIVGGWDPNGKMADRTVELQPTPASGDELLKPAYAVRVQVQRRNPLQVQANNEFVLQVAQICAQGGQPLPPDVVVGLLEGYPKKQIVLDKIAQNNQRLIMMQQMEETIKQQEGKIGQLQKANAALLEGKMSSPGGAPVVQPQAGMVPDYTDISLPGGKAVNGPTA